MNPMDPRPQRILAPIDIAYRDTLDPMFAAVEAVYREESPKEVITRMMRGGQQCIAQEIDPYQYDMYGPDKAHLYKYIAENMVYSVSRVVEKKVELQVTNNMDRLTDTISARVFVFSPQEMSNIFREVRKLKTDEDIAHIIVAMEEMKNDKPD